MSISVVIATYNRAGLLADCLDSLSAQAYRPGDAVVLVDNGSTDETARVAADAKERLGAPLFYLREPRPGKSHALNTALSVCNTDVLALTDDDVRVESDWLASIRRVMLESGAVLIGGRVLPLFRARAPEWLELRGARGFGRLASPLALLDYGPERETLGARTVLGANMAVSRTVFQAAGGFDGSLGKLRGTLLSGEDHRLCEQVQAAGHLALYDPTIVVHHVVPPERLTIGYFIRWFFWSGVTHARIEAAKGVATPTLLRLPRHQLRQACASAAMAAASAVAADWSRLVSEATRTAFATGYISASRSGVLHRLPASGQEPGSGDRMNVSMLTVLLCTYNRSSFLRETLRAISALPRRGDYAVEVIVVDNNSTDATSEVVRQEAAQSPIAIRYEFEARQGKSFALNRGLRSARGEVIAHTDDDVWPDEQWLDRIVDAFRTHDITFAFGKVRPRWERLPPPELLTSRAHQIWGPLAIVDYGDEVQLYRTDSRGQRLPVGANLALSRQALSDVGGWRTDLGKVDNSLISGEDHEIFYRLRNAGAYAGLYDPDISVRHFVPASRMTRRYFRRWFYWHGKTMARMPEEIFDLDLTQVPHVAGVPRFLYRQMLQQAWRWCRMAVRRDALGTLIEELQVIEYCGIFAQYWRWLASGGRKHMDHLDEPIDKDHALPIA